MLDRLAGCWTIVDVGSGAGNLLAEAERTGFDAVGVEPSRAMHRLSRRRGVLTCVGRAQSLPLGSGTTDAVVSTYPGGWILDAETWSEFARVLRPGGLVIVLLGGTVERGRGSRIRRAVQRLAYGSAAGISDHPWIQRLGHPGIPGDVEIVDDQWGKAILWVGRRR